MHPYLSNEDPADQTDAAPEAFVWKPEEIPSRERSWSDHDTPYVRFSYCQNHPSTWEFLARHKERLITEEMRG